LFGVALNDNGVNCDLPVGRQVVGGWESRSFVSSRRVQAKSRRHRGLYSTVNNV